MSYTERKAAIVTGAGRGIGAAIAQRLGHDGFGIVVNYSGNPHEAEQIAEEIEKAGGQSITAQADVTEPTAVERMFEMADVAFGGVDVLVNNAGIMRLSSIALMDDTMFDSQVAVNLRGTFNMLRAGARRIRPGGRIINISSSQVGLYHETYAVYAATKAGVEAMTRTLAKELRGRNITVNAIAPGPTATKLFLDGKGPDLIEQLAKLAPLERLGQPAEIAAVASFLAGQDGSWINGQVIRTNGGIV
jgi:3-oxoacyl-[acyl-carrier protein] reductase